MMVERLDALMRGDEDRASVRDAMRDAGDRLHRALGALTAEKPTVFESLLSSPLEQFDPNSEVLAMIAKWQNAPSATYNPGRQP